MIRAFTSETEIAEAQQALRLEFYSNAQVSMHSVGFPGGNVEVDVAWHSSIGIWGYIDTPESAFGPDGAGGRYWNTFGLEDPSTHRSSLSITVEVNPPLQGAHPNVAGVIGRDGEGVLTLAHRGTIGGGKSGVGKGLFWENYMGPTDMLYDGIDITESAFVARLGTGTLLNDLRRFVEEVARIKRLAVKR